MKSGTHPSWVFSTILAPTARSPVHDLGLRDQPFLPGVLGDARHQQPPVRVARVVVPDQDASRRLDDADHLGQRPAHVAGVGDVVHHCNRERQIEGVVGKRKLGPRGPHGGDRWSSGAEDLEHAVRGIDARHVVAHVREPGRQSACATAYVQPRAARAVLGHEGGPLGEVVLDYVSWQ